MSTIPALEKRRTRVSTGSGNPVTLAATHPFLQQIDVVYPSNQALDIALGDLQTRYYRGRTRITDVLSRVGDGRSDVLMLTPNMSGSSDVWCIDLRGVLTLSVCKEAYETLGLPGKSLPFKGHADQHVVEMTLKNTIESATIQAKQKALLNAWEERRNAQDGLDGWDVVYCSQDLASGDFSDFGIANAQLRPVTCTKKALNSVHIPIPTFPPRPNVPHGERKKSDTSAAVEELDHWTEATMELNEWVGLATLGSQRLQANDRVNPFVAVYEPPQPSQIGDVTHLSWRGLLSPQFVQSIIDMACATQGDINNSPSFLSITCHGIPSSPVGYLPLQSSDNTKLPKTPARLPRTDSEDTFTLLLSRDPSDKLSWTLLESIGQWDTRWG